MAMSETRECSPAIFLAEGDFPDGSLTSPDLVILNQPISSFTVFSRLWKHTKYRICADGGANRLYDMFECGLQAQREDYVSVGTQTAFNIADAQQLPHAIHGDLDSLRDDVRTYYANQGVEVSQDHDQYSTDFGKAMHKITSENGSTGDRDVLVLGTLAGRVDQGLGLLHEMLREETRNAQLRLWLFSESSLSFLLRSPHTILRGLVTGSAFTENVGLLPIYGPAAITTSGLEWDVEDWDTKMGGQVSTSNHVKADEVHVQTNAPILFTIERAPLDAESSSRVEQQARGEKRPTIFV